MTSEAKDDLIAGLLAGPVRTGDTEDGDYELFDIEDAQQLMFDAASTITRLTAENDKMREALIFIVDRENLTFAECTDAEEIINRARSALSNTSEGGKGE